MEYLTPVNVVLGCAAAFALRRLLTPGEKPKAPPPPGPKPLPVLGNLLDMPPPGGHDWMHWAKHKELYGPISVVSVMGMQIVIISDWQYAVELLDKKSIISSDRVQTVFGGKLCGWERSLAMTCYGDRFKKIRRDLHQVIGTSSALRKFHSLEEIEGRRFLLRVLDAPDQLYEHLRRTTGAVILAISHGYTIDQKDDPLIHLADECLAEASIAFQPGSWVVDFVPFLRFLPEWLPGMGFKKVGRAFFNHVVELLERPHEFVKQQMALGLAAPSYTKDTLEKTPNYSPEDESCIKWAAASIYGGGSDTTVSITYSFYLAMMLHPEIQRKAQEEIDRVVGTDRLPTIEDQPNLPYVAALVKETLRWYAILPMGLPHIMSQDEIFKGYLLPKGALIMPNIQLFTRDEKTFHDPMTFKPERHMDTEGRPAEADPRNMVFGFGRRICPGKDLADLSLFVLFSMTLAAFNITKAKDAAGNEIDAKSEWLPGLISRPKEFVCSITPRSSKAEALVRSIEEEHPVDKNDAETLSNVQFSRSPVF
ncbi:cytochrome P450 oxidoreductase OrdA-like protein [Schizopora paradoxa]|uniref:Cytochrome P450 oxidoreductase OrdA-like protein n=1 Tax=Schizopora paradoxa TaxID=27342 RepID=A0A0H2SFV5_9AGAM|nr:cytochrome P450 oxidoreductase OrdA-like protein [Schizopora paradoxa]